MMSEEEKKAIKWIEGEYKNATEKGNILFPLYITDARRVLNLIEKQQKELEQEKEKNKELEKYKTYYEEMEEVNKKFIAVDKIKEKIKELEKEFKEFKEQDFISEATKRYQQLQILNDILEEENAEGNHIPRID